MDRIRQLIGILGLGQFTIFIVIILIALLFIFSTFFTHPKKPENLSPKTFPDRITNQEENYPDNLPQSFSKPPDKGSGILIVTSEPSNARMVIDLPEEEIPVTQPVAPVNHTPFKVLNIPAGKYTFEAFKKGYSFTESSFEILPGKVTRVNINLQPETNR